MSMRSFLPSFSEKNDKSQTPIESLQNVIDKAFADFNRSFGMSDPGAWPAAFSGTQSPKIDVTETEDSIEVSAELPGVEQDDIDVTIVDDVLTIKGEKKFEKEEKKKDYHLVERSYGSFQRAIRLPFTAQSDADATFKNGVLKLTIKKPPEMAAKTRRISIKSS